VDAPEAAAQPEGERRQLTVMFCDLVGSTQLSASLDPEEFSDVVRAYQGLCAEAVKRFDGYVAQYHGDGIVVYFGYPQAHEDDAERAIRAGLELQQQLAQRDVPVQTRVGIHTGAVVVSAVGDAGRRETVALGDTTNIAARLQAVAEPGGLVVSANTLRLARGLFVTRDLGTPELKGVSEPIRAYAVERGSGVRRRVERTEGLTPLTGREREVDLLLDRWEQVEQGRGHVLFVVGEAGIGKTRLVGAFRDALGERPHSWLDAGCSPYTAASAFQPLIDLMERGMAFADCPSAQDKLERLERSIEILPGASPETIVPYLAPLLSLPASKRYPLPTISPELQRERAIDAQIQLILALQLSQPLLMSVEDLHWADPSTLDHLTRLIDRVPQMRVMVILTARPGFQPPWSLSAPQVSPVSLARLTRRDTRAMVAAVAGGRGLPGPLLDQLAERADGVPLFAEELTRSVLDSGIVVEEQGRYELRGRMSDLSIPDTLQDSLMARLDRLSASKQLAQQASNLGRDFTYELLEASFDNEPAVLRTALRQLVDAEILQQRGTPPHADYSFKHALLQDTAYESQLKSVRRERHARIAAALEERFPERVAAEPELMAHHCERGGLSEKAVTHHQRAGEKAVGRLANAEAEASFRRALENLATLPSGAGRDQREIEICLALAGPLTAQHGYDAPQVLAHYERIGALRAQLEEGPLQIPALLGLTRYHMRRGAFLVAHDLSASILRIAEPLGMQFLQVLGHGLAGFASSVLTSHLRAVEQFSRALEIAERTDLPPPASAYDPDLVTLILINHALALVSVGRIEEGLAAVEAAHERALGLDHEASLVTARFQVGVVYYLLDQPDEARRSTDEALALVEGRSLHAQDSFARVCRGWARVASGDAEGLDDAEAALAHAVESGVLGARGLLYVIAAHAAALAVRLERAWELIRIARDMARRGNEKVIAVCVDFVEAEILAAEGRREEAAHAFRTAMENASRAGMFTVELRAATGLARLADGDGERAEAREQLAASHARFSQGFESKPLREARRLLDELTR
jgi:class 3 adenylate cyclase/tetratricopeptide (TPR) repeat protein